MKILVIDDDALVRRTLLKMLRFGGHDTLEADNGVTGLELFRKEMPDIVVTDIIMPEQEGLGTIMMMRRERPDTKIIAISGGGRVGNVDVLDAAQALGAAAIIHKPFAADQLLARIDGVADSRVVNGAAGPTERKDPGAQASGGMIAQRRLTASPLERVRSPFTNPR